MADPERESRANEKKGAKWIRAIRFQAGDTPGRGSSAAVRTSATPGPTTATGGGRP